MNLKKSLQLLSPEKPPQMRERVITKIFDEDSSIAISIDRDRNATGTCSNKAIGWKSNYRQLCCWAKKHACARKHHRYPANRTAGYFVQRSCGAINRAPLWWRPVKRFRTSVLIPLRQQCRPSRSPSYEHAREKRSMATDGGSLTLGASKNHPNLGIASRVSWKVTRDDTHRCGGALRLRRELLCKMSTHCSLANWEKPELHKYW